MRAATGLILGIMGGLVIFGRLGCPLLEPEEARYAEIPRQMLVEDRFVVPVWHGQAYLHKPPLLYWLVMGCYRLFGVNDIAARLAPCVAAWFTLMAVYLWTARQAGQDAACWTGLLLCLTAGFIYRGPMLSMDSLLTFFVVVGLWCAYEALSPTRQRGSASQQPLLPPALALRAHVDYRWWLLSALCCGLGVLTKGPVAIVLIAVPIALFRIVAADRRRIARQDWLIYLALAAAVAAPWYLAVACLEPAASWDFFWLHNAQRFLTPFDHAEPFWYYVPVLLVALLPGSLLLPWLLLDGRGIIRRMRVGGSPAVLAGLGGTCCVVFFSLSGCKRAGYILPALPLLAMVLGMFLHGKLGLSRGWRLGTRMVAAPLAALFGLELLTVYGLLPAYHHGFSMRAEVHRHLDAARQPGVQVACYPRGWDSVHFYLDHADVRVFSREQSDRLGESLRSARPMLLFVKAAHLDEVRALLPAQRAPKVSWSQGRNVAVVFMPPASTSHVSRWRRDLGFTTAP